MSACCESILVGEDDDDIRVAAVALERLLLVAGYGGRSAAGSGP